MSGAGKWIKKHPVEAVGLALGGAMLGPALPGLLGGMGAAGAAGAGAGAGLLAEGLGAGAASEAVGSLAGGTLASEGVAGGLAEGLGAGAADEMLSAVPATMGDKFGTFMGNAKLGLSKIGPTELLLANAGIGLLSPQQQQMPPMAGGGRPQMIAQGPSSTPLPYGDPLAEEERRRRMAQTGRFYG